MSAKPPSATQLETVSRFYAFLAFNCMSLNEAASGRKLMSYFLFTKRAPGTWHLAVPMWQRWPLVYVKPLEGEKSRGVHRAWRFRHTCLVVRDSSICPVSLAGAEWPPLFQWKVRRDLRPTLRMRTPMRKSPGNPEELLHGRVRISALTFYNVWCSDKNLGSA